MKVGIVIAATLAGLLPAPASADTIVEAIARYDRATIAGDTVALAAIVTPDYLLVNSDASVQGRESYLADFRVPGFKLDPYQLEQTFTKVQGHAAMTGGLFDLHWSQAGERHDRRLRIAHFWVKRGGVWRLSFTQLTRVPA